MNQFSTTNTRGQICIPCQNGNVFYLGNPSDAPCPPITGFVNSQSSGALPMCQVVGDKTFETSGAVELQIRGKTYPLISNMEAFGQCTVPNQVQVHIGIATPPAPMTPMRPPVAPVTPAAPTATNVWQPSQTRQQVPIGQYSSARMPYQRGTIAAGDEANALDVIAEMNLVNLPQPQEKHFLITTIEVDPEYGPPPNGEGTKHVDTLTTAEEEWVGTIIADWVKRAGRTAISTIDKLTSGNNWAWIKEMGFKTMRFWRHSKSGKMMVSFAGNNQLRHLLTATNYGAAGLAGKQISFVDSAFRTPAQNAMSGVRSIGKPAGIIGMVFVVGVDVIEYMADPSEEKVITDLIVDLGFDISIAAASTIAGAVLVGWGLATFGALAAAPVAVVVVGVILVGVAVGIGIGWLVGLTGAREGMKEALRNAESNAPVVQDVHQSIRW